MLFKKTKSTAAQTDQQAEIVSQALDAQARLYSLQRQINPHFLYNTLETIRGMAISHKEPDIARMTELLARILRYNIGTAGQLVPLTRELENVDNYISIQMFRFRDKFTLVKQFEDDLSEHSSLMIPVLTLQPIIENAIHHGLESKTSQGTITLRIFSTEENLFIRVTDDGIGMTEETLHKLNSLLENPVRTDVLPQTKQRNSGLALMNIQQRIRLIFGQAYGLRIMSEFGIGTCVELVLPKRYEGKSDET